MAGRLTQSDQQAIARLRELNEKRTPGPWHVEAGDDECCSCISGIIGESEKRRLEADNRIHRGDFPEDTHWIVVDPGCSPVRVVDNFDFIAELANACDPKNPWLLDAAERGVEAERILEQLESERSQFVKHLAAVIAERDRMRQLLLNLYDSLNDRYLLRDAAMAIDDEAKRLAAARQAAEEGKG